MRKKVFGKKLGRNTNSRKALFRSLTQALVFEGKVVTTKAKAKAVTPFVEKLMTKVVKNDLASRKAVVAKLGNNKKVAKVLFGEYGPNIKDKKSGFTRIVLLPNRKGDNAEMVSLEWTIERKVEEQKKEEKKKK